MLSFANFVYFLLLLLCTCHLGLIWASPDALSNTRSLISRWSIEFLWIARGSFSDAKFAILSGGWSGQARATQQSCGLFSFLKTRRVCLDIRPSKPLQWVMHVWVSRTVRPKIWAFAISNRVSFMTIAAKFHYKPYAIKFKHYVYLIHFKNLTKSQMFNIIKQYEGTRKSRKSIPKCVSQNL